MTHMDDDLDTRGNTKVRTRTRTKPDTRTRTKPVLKRPSMWNVIILNDDFTPMDFVVFILQRIFGKDVSAAKAMMWQVHIEGKAVAGTYTYEVAETKQGEVMALARREGHPLKIEIEPAPEV